MLPVNVIEFLHNVTAPGARLYEFNAPLMHLTVDIPQAQVLIWHMIQKQSSFQSGVIAKEF